VHPHGAPGAEERIAWMMLSKPEFREACEGEGVNVDWGLVRRLAGVKKDVGTGVVKGRRERRRSRGVWSKL